MNKRDEAVAERLTAGTHFDTDSEANCVVLSSPNERGDFDGVDSEGVEVLFNVRQVTNVHDGKGGTKVTHRGDTLPINEDQYRIGKHKDGRYSLVHVANGKRWLTWSNDPNSFDPTDAEEIDYDEAVKVQLQSTVIKQG